MHDALVEFIRSGGETETKDVNVAQYVRQLTLPDDNGDTPLHTPVSYTHLTLPTKRIV